MTFEITPDVEVRRDQEGVARSLRHLQQPYTETDAGLTAPTPRSLAGQYVRDVAEIYDIDPGWLVDLDQPLPRNASTDPTDEGTRLRFTEERGVMETTTVTYQQTHRGLPVWEAELSVRMHDDSLRTTSSQSSIHYDIRVVTPDEERPEVIGAFERADYTADAVDADDLEDLLGQSEEGAFATERGPEITRRRSLVYRYDSELRFDPESERGQREADSDHEGPPTLPLPPVPDEIEDGTHYVVTEVLFTLARPELGPINWRAFVEPVTGAVLYLRAFVETAHGNVFPADFLTDTPQPDIDCCDPAGTLDPLTEDVTLAGLTAPDPGDDQSLSGEYIDLQDTNSPAVAPPTAPLPEGDFSSSAPTDDFAAVSAYYYLDSLYRMVDDLGFDVSGFFSGTSFPIPTDHRGVGGGVNAFHFGSSSGTTKFTFGLCRSGCDVGIAADVRIVVHEFAHSVLRNSIGSGTFGFAHGIGDSLAVVLNDPGTPVADRFRTFPWSTLITRRHDRDVTAGWAWGGTNDSGGYPSTQILATTLFRVYRSTGGDDDRLNVQRFAARYLAYLLVRAVGSMTSNTSDPAVFATAIMDADQGTTDFEGHPGGAFHKVVRWGFEQQGLYQPPGAPTPVSTEGAPPETDVYVDDGRDGEYEYQRNFWNTTDMWNRTSPDGGTDHQTPVVGTSNYMYVRVKNRGTGTAENTAVSAYHCKPATGLVWPDDWQTMTTAELSAGSLSSGGETVVGPFEWTPETVGHECLLVSVSADGDPSNADTVNGSIPHWRLVPFDNNIAQRNVAPVAGGGGATNLASSFADRRFWVNNPFDRPVDVELERELPAFLRQRGWHLRFRNPGGASFSLGPRGSREVVLELEAGSDFTPEDVRKAGEETAIDVLTFVDDLPVGGMRYDVDPTLKTPPREHPKPDDDECNDTTERLLDCLDIPAENVKSTKVKRITLDIELDDDCDC